MNPSAKYLHFASNVSFFDFPGDIPEFRTIKVDSDLDSIAEKLQSRTDWDLASLSAFLMANPKAFEVIEGLFQMKRFTNAQLTWFTFDVEKLNSTNFDSIYEYVVGELRNDPFCESLFMSKVRESSNTIVTLDDILQDDGRFPRETVLAFFKIVVSDYVSIVSTNFDHLATRIANPNLGVAARFAHYAVDVLRLNKFLEAVDTRKYLVRKLIPTDTKSNHGKFATNKVRRSLERANFMNVENKLKSGGSGKILPRKLDLGRLGLDPNGKYYLPETFVEGIQKPREGGLKKFDFVVFVKGEPRHLFEVNFYSTEGTKIGINRDEYIGLSDSISQDGRFKFHWITDGNFWLTSNGEKLFETLVGHYVDIYNLNMFAENFDLLTS